MGCFEFERGEGVELDAVDQAAVVAREGAPADVVVAGRGTVRILEVTVDSHRERASFPGPVVVRGIATGDLDGNGSTDLVLGDFANGAAHLYFLDEERRLVRPVVVLAAGIFAEDVVAADVDGDDALDVIVALGAENAVAVFRGGGDGSFSDPQRFEAGPRPGVLSVGDVDGDGRKDIVTASLPPRSRVSLLRGRGSGDFDAPVPIGVALDTRGITIVDVTGDEKEEVFIASFGDEISGALQVFQSTDDGVQGVTLQSGIRPTALVVADITADKVPEILFADARRGSLTIVQWAGGAEIRRTSLSLPSNLEREPVFQLSIGDMNADGLQDVLVAETLGGTLEPLFGCREEVVFRRGDVLADGSVQLTDAINLLQHLFSGGEDVACPDAADTNDDGDLNLTDAVGILVYLFGGGPAPAAPGPEECGRDPTPDMLNECSGLCL